MAQNYFTPPTYTLKNVNAGPLLSRFQTTYAYSVVKRGATYENVISPDISMFSDPSIDTIYQGGHKYPITSAEAALLNAAGYTTTLE